MQTLTTVPKKPSQTGDPDYLRPIISRIVRSRRSEILAELSIRVGQRVTLSMLNDWTSPTKPRTRFPACFIASFCEVTDNDELQRAILSPKLLELLKLGEIVASLVEKHFLGVQKKNGNE
jgi:hypothetical protein